jgi:hypothetical protein
MLIGSSNKMGQFGSKYIKELVTLPHKIRKNTNRNYRPSLYFQVISDL